MIGDQRRSFGIGDGHVDLLERLAVERTEVPAHRWRRPLTRAEAILAEGASRCHFAQRCDSDGLPPLGYASGEDHGIGRTRTRVIHQEACDVLVIYLAPLPRGFLFG